MQLGDLFKTRKQREADKLEAEERERRKNEGIEEPTERQRQEVGEDLEKLAFKDAVQSNEEENVAAKEKALEACNDLHVQWYACIKKGTMFNTCTAESEAFWECYKKERGFLKSRVDVWREKFWTKSETQSQQNGGPSSSQ
eukprot:comp16914_c0_seq1/m.15464 comp16914_c0_seq1/g.15464  ORF comp16914_c0_seq1/g.15464 comp16914_c0_seq1/m.15464 type:complete len:141 (-) comp16914_c0_seq1:414-836(-)